MTLSISFSKTETTKKDTMVVGIFEGNMLTSGAKALDKNTEGLVMACLKNNASFKGKNGQFLTIPVNRKSLSRIILMGLGEREKFTPILIETLGGKLYSCLKSAGAINAVIDLNDMEIKSAAPAADLAARFAMGLTLRSYNFDKYKSKKKNDDSTTTLEKAIIMTEAESAATKAYSAYSAVAQGVFLARDLVNEPPNTLYPESYVERIKQELKPLGVEVEVLDEKKMQKLGFGALLAVGQGSARRPHTVIMKWNGAGAKSSAKSKPLKTPIAFVGKGVTFDTGGISLKPGAEMDLMKMDMGGSAAVVGVMKSLALRKAKTNAVGIVGLVENMPSDRAYRPGDIITSLEGKTIEVLNTDAEGRLVLADILTYIQNTYKPEVVIDLATLTGAIMVGLGFEYCGAFANDNDLWQKIESCGLSTGEKYWRMPLDEAYRKEMESEVADLKNLGSLGRYGGACSAAGFLEHFIKEGTKWAHLDIAGTAWWKSDKPTTPKGGTGFGVRMLNDLVAEHFEK